MRFNLTIDCDNAAFEEDAAGEVARIVAEYFQGEPDNRPLFDVNGNRVGAAEWIDRE